MNFELQYSSTLRNMFTFSAFFYPNTKFIYGDGLPDFKAVKQSAIKLQAVLSNKRFEYLISILALCLSYNSLIEIFFYVDIFLSAMTVNGFLLWMTLIG